MSSPGLDRRALALGIVAAGLSVFASAAGSGWFRWFDTALAGYLFGMVFFAFATVYRYTVWLRRPPTAKLHARGWETTRKRRRLGIPTEAASSRIVE